MKSVYTHIPDISDRQVPYVLAVILETKGSTPQDPGAAAIISEDGILAGTLGGGILEGEAVRKSAEALKNRSSLVYTLGLNSNIDDPEGAICGGSAMILIDAEPEKSRFVFEDVSRALKNNRQGFLATVVTGKDPVKVNRYWIQQNKPVDKNLPGLLHQSLNEMIQCLHSGEEICIRKENDDILFLEHIKPLPRLIIAGAGHVGRALAHYGNRLGFDITIIDDRTEYANPGNIPDADRFINEPGGKAIQKIPMNQDTYVVIVTRDHRNDTKVLKECIQKDIPYIGMIGSKRKINLIRRKFLEQGWATAEEFSRINAPVGLDIGSRTVEEIAISISAQLIQVRNEQRLTPVTQDIRAIVLAAGESKRMGKPKMTLPYGKHTIIEQVVSNAVQSELKDIVVVLGSACGTVGSVLRLTGVKMAYNPFYRNGMLTSVQCGLHHMPDTVAAVMILLGDQPMIGTTVINRLTRMYDNSDRGIIVAAYRGKRGHPVLIRKKYFKEILGFNEGQSLKDLLNLHSGDIEEVACDSPEILRDIDTKNDYLEELKYHQTHE